MKKINDLYASAWEQAINETAKVVNKITGNSYNIKNDWLLLETYATYNGFVFDEDGNKI